jgi:hypothetical protein
MVVPLLVHLGCTTMEGLYYDGRMCAVGSHNIFPYIELIEY